MMWEDPTTSAYDVRLTSWEVAFESAEDTMNGDHTLTHLDVMEYRPPVVKDICTHTLTDETWDCMGDLLRDHDDMCTDDGCPALDSAYKKYTDPRPLAWHRLRAAIQHVLDDHLDLSEAAWQPTGRVRRVTHDGTSYQWEEISGPILDEPSKTLWEQLKERSTVESEHLARCISKLERVENLAKHAWEQVDRNPEEAKEIFRNIYAISK